MTTYKDAVNLYRKRQYAEAERILRALVSESEKSAQTGTGDYRNASNALGVVLRAQGRAGRLLPSTSERFLKSAMTREFYQI